MMRDWHLTDVLASLRQQDERALHLMVAKRRRLTDTIMRVVTELGDARMVVGLVLGVSAGFPELATYAAFTLVSSHVLVQLLKRAVNRARPCLPAGTARLLEPPDRFSFPSGHAAASLSLALTFAVALPPTSAALLLGLAILTGLSRAYLGVHYPGDVLAGWLLAWGCSLLAGPALRMLAGF
jgi:undecaprenyl-diphosphatase